MSEKEIKECLDSLYYQDDVCSISYDKLKDYITNLQQEIERLNNNWNKLKDWANEPKVYICHYHIVDKMNEIEQGSDKEC